MDNDTQLKKGLSDLLPLVLLELHKVGIARSNIVSGDDYYFNEIDGGRVAESELSELVSRKQKLTALVGAIEELTQ